jgi:hypothetical protein
MIPWKTFTRRAPVYGRQRRTCGAADLIKREAGGFAGRSMDAATRKEVRGPKSGEASHYLSARRSIASMSLSSLRLIWPSCAAEYSTARAPWRLDVSGGTMNPLDSGGSNGKNSSEIVFCHEARITSVSVMAFSQCENAHYHASCD